MAASFDRKRAPILDHQVEDLSNFVDIGWLHTTGRDGFGLLRIPDTEVGIIAGIVNGGIIFQGGADLLTLQKQVSQPMYVEVS